MKNIDDNLYRLVLIGEVKRKASNKTIKEYYKDKSTSNLNLQFKCSEAILSRGTAALLEECMNNKDNKKYDRHYYINNSNDIIISANEIFNFLLQETELDEKNEKLNIEFYDYGKFYDEIIAKRKENKIQNFIVKFIENLKKFADNGKLDQIKERIA